MTQVDEKLLQKHRAQILAATGDGVYGMDIEGKTTFSNPAAERMTGYSSEEMLGKPSHDLIHHTYADGSDFPKQECAIYAAFKDGKIHRVSDEVFWRKDGSSFPVEYISTPIMEDDVIVGAVVSFQDITERKRADEALRESEERYRTIVEATHDIIFLLRAHDGAILDANEEACRMLGYSREEMMTKTALDIHADAVSDLQKFMASIRAHGRAKTDRLSCLALNGERIPVRLSASAIQLQGNECFLIMAQDLREYQQAEKRVRKLQADLHHGSRLSAMGEMASGMAHELNQPLTAVMSYLQACQLILDSGSQEQRDKVSEYIGKSIDQAERAGKIISGLRTFVHKSDASRTLEDLNEIVEEASDLMLSGAAVEDIEFQIDCAENLPPIFVDKIQIQQVVFNLVRNAAEALAGTKNGRLKVTTLKDDDGSVSVSVYDNGAGVDDELLDKLFDAFVTTKAEGMGVGLSICKSIVEDHGGNIQADRNSDGGMTFAFTLPATKGDAND